MVQFQKSRGKGLHKSEQGRYPLTRRPKIVKTGVNHYDDLPDIARRLYRAMAQRL